MKNIVAALLFILILAACGTPPAAEPTVDLGAVQTEAVLTAFAQQTKSVPAATATQAPTRVPTNTKTLIPTLTIVPSSTPAPATGTAAAKELGATQTAYKITVTAIAKSNQATEIARYQPIDLKELLTYPDNHKGEQVVIRGRIFNIDGKVVQIYVRGYDAVYIQMEDEVSGIYEDDYITVYGTVFGSYCFKNSLGNQVCQPAIFRAFYEKK